MGIGKGPAILLMKEALRKSFNGSLLTLGKQELLMSPYQLKRYAKATGFSLKMPTYTDPYAPMLDRDFFSLLGFSQVNSLDYSDFEGASIIFDLNSGDTSEAFREAFDVIYDGGTMEHVFHLPNVLKSIIWMLKPGGRLIHLSPASNHLEHSFYMFSPTFFYDFYQSNKFEVNYVQIVRCTPCFDYKYVVYNYDHAGCLANSDVGMGRLDTGMYLVHTVVTKTAQSTSSAIPNQSIYSSDLWRRTQTIQQTSFLKRWLKEESYRKWKQRFKMSPFYPIWAYCKLKFRRYGVPLKVADRF
ncbi:MAG: hypothetical protein HW387_161 [Parachlamydiales bacterium]|nr:hypothetical protein [Parachlamydiales bacterium]